MIYEYVVRTPLEVNGNSYQPGDVLAPADEDAVLSHRGFAQHVVRRVKQS